MIGTHLTEIEFLVHMKRMTDDRKQICSCCRDRLGQSLLKMSRRHDVADVLEAAASAEGIEDSVYPAACAV